LTIARDVWGRHPDELAGEPYDETMLWDFLALALVESDEFESRRSK